MKEVESNAEDYRHWKSADWRVAVEANSHEKATEKKVISPPQSQSANQVVKGRGHKNRVKGEAQANPANHVRPVSEPCQQHGYQSDAAAADFFRE